jgi:hypothetical protein
MNRRSIARIVAIAFGVAPSLWASAAHAQLAVAPDLVISRVGLTCAGMVVTVTNTGRSAVSASAPLIAVRGSVVVDANSPQTMDAPLAVAGLEPSQTKTVTLPIPNAAAAYAINATVDATNRITERDETNNVRTTIDETSCPMLTVSGARVVEGGDLVFTVTIDKRPLQDASVTWSTLAGSIAAGGTACGGTIDFVRSSGTLLFPASGFVALTPKTIRITTCRDAITEPAETMTLLLGGFRNVASRSLATTGTIDNQNP